MPRADPGGEGASVAPESTVFNSGLLSQNGTFVVSEYQLRGALTWYRELRTGDVTVTPLP